MKVASELVDANRVNDVVLQSKELRLFLRCNEEPGDERIRRLVEPTCGQRAETTNDRKLDN
jgi:hypothetical protein